METKTISLPLWKHLTSNLIVYPLSLVSLLTVTSVTLTVSGVAVDEIHVRSNFSTSPDTSFSDYTRLFRDVIYSHDRRIRPVKNKSTPLDVHIHFYLLSLIKLDELNQEMVISTWLTFNWVDEIRTWDPDQYGGIEMIHPEPSDVWRPKLFVINSQGDKRDVFANDASFMFMFADGTSEWDPGSVMEVSCAFDLTYFPFDKQSCRVSFLSLDFSYEVHFIPESENVATPNYENNGEWDLTSGKISSTAFRYVNTFLEGKQDVNISSIDVTLEFKRRPMFYVVNILAPVISLSALSSLVFVLPADSGERASYSVTILLALSVFMTIIAGQLPNNSDTFPIIAHYLLALFAQSGLCVITSVYLLRWGKRSGSDGIKSHQESDGNVFCTFSSTTNAASIKPDNKPDGSTFGPDLINRFERDEKNQHANIRPLADLEVCGVCVGTTGQNGAFENQTATRKLPTGKESSSTDQGKHNVYGERVTTRTGRVRTAINKWLRDRDCQMFVIFNVVWISTTIFFVMMLLN